MMLEHRVCGPMSWEADTLLPNDGKVELTAACAEEIRALAADLKANPLPVEALKADDYVLSRCREFMASIKLALDCGLGFMSRSERDRIVPTRLGCMSDAGTGAPDFDVSTPTQICPYPLPTKNSPGSRFRNHSALWDGSSRPRPKAFPVGALRCCGNIEGL